METIEFGKVYFIKDGEVIERTLHTNERKLLEMASTQELHVATIPALEETIDQNYACHLHTKTLESYIDFLKNGYSIIRVAYSFRFKRNNDGEIIEIRPFQKESNTIISETIDKTSHQRIIEAFQQANEGIDEGYQYIYNINRQNEVLDYDYLEHDQTNRNYSMLEKLDVLLREKIDALNPEEQEMMKQYRNYDLNSILTTDYKPLIINHGNAGVIVITPDKIYEKTTTKLQHGTEMKWCLRNAGLINKGEDHNIWSLVNHTNSIIIQLCKDEAILWLNPEESRTDYQETELKRIMNIMNEIKQNGNNLDIIASICENSFFRKISNEDILKKEANEDNIKRAM